MTWFTWRQFRTQSWIAVGVLAAAVVALVLTALHVADLYGEVASCHGNCGQVFDDFLGHAKSGASGVVYNVSIYGLYVVPPLIGAFWGAPLVARELESGTHRLAWNQTVTRTRWLVTKLLLVGGAAMLTTGLLSLVATLALHHVDHGALIQPTLFGVRGIAPVAYAAFAFALGVAAGAVLRRTVPAMAVTLAVYIAVALTMALAVRGHLLPVRTLTAPISGDPGSIHGISIFNHGHMQVWGGADAPNGAWVISDTTYTPSGVVFSGPAPTQFCGDGTGPDTCISWLGTQNLHQSLSYQPVSHYWPMQWIESGIFLVLALLLGGFSLWWTRRRVS
ncbi:MAG TPA: ABC transporter permease subunit [Micromonosporaceae bacterium]|nr:ABC transporter permease subunit [Micromonosporaceae bacterium]